MNGNHHASRSKMFHSNDVFLCKKDKAEVLKHTLKLYAFILKTGIWSRIMLKYGNDAL